MTKRYDDSHTEKDKERKTNRGREKECVGVERKTKKKQQQGNEK